MSRTEPWCPKCVRALTGRAHEGRAIWSCDQCDGAFLPAQQLRDIAAVEHPPRAQHERDRELDAAAARELPRSEVLEAPTACPWCDRIMGRERYEQTSAIMIDRCSQGCGIWLDSGELERVEAWSEGVRSST